MIRAFFHPCFNVCRCGSLDWNSRWRCGCSRYHCYHCWCLPIEENRSEKNISVGICISIKQLNRNRLKYKEFVSWSGCIRISRESCLRYCGTSPFIPPCCSRQHASTILILQRIICGHIQSAFLTLLMRTIERRNVIICTDFVHFVNVT